ncbi:MAG: hypothetical protein PUD88_03240 [Prevotellaceae bacterium]|nr:hypothetical protein [Prevotellaceae bacterium]
MKLYDADKLTEQGIRKAILTCMLSYDADHDTPWDRELDELAVEWGGHALFFWADQSARDIDFDNAEANKSHFYFVKKAIKRGWGKVVGE